MESNEGMGKGQSGAIRLRAHYYFLVRRRIIILVLIYPERMKQAPNKKDSILGSRRKGVFQ